MKNILVLLPLDDELKKTFEEKADSYNFVYERRSTVTEDQVNLANIIIGSPPIRLLKASENLKWLQLESAGVEAYLKEGVLSKDTILTNASGAYGLAISEFMLGLLFSLYKKLYLYRDNQHEAKWENLGKVKAVKNSTALILGLGDIDSEFARRLKALDVNVLAIRRNIKDKPDYVDKLYSMEDLDELLPKADILALSLPSTKLTKGLIDRRRIGLMKEGAVLLNVGRGDTLDTEALADALEAGSIGGAGLDVVDPEPLPEDHRLWSMQNTIITPHVSGNYSIEEIYDEIVKISLYNLESYLEGRSLKNVISFEDEY